MQNFIRQHGNLELDALRDAQPVYTGKRVTPHTTGEVYSTKTLLTVLLALYVAWSAWREWPWRDKFLPYILQAWKAELHK